MNYAICTRCGTGNVFSLDDKEVNIIAPTIGKFRFGLGTMLRCASCNEEFFVSNDSLIFSVFHNVYTFYEDSIQKAPVMQITKKDINAFKALFENWMSGEYGVWWTSAEKVSEFLSTPIALVICNYIYSTDSYIRSNPTGFSIYLRDGAPIVFDWETEW